MLSIKKVAALLAATVAGTGALVGGSVAPAQAENCVGFPSIPPTYLCVVSFTPQNATPSVDPDGGGEITIPSFCYFIGCTEDTPVPLPSVTFNQGDVLVFTHNGKEYHVTGDPTDLDPGLDPLEVLEGIRRKLLNQGIQIRTGGTLDVACYAYPTIVGCVVG